EKLPKVTVSPHDADVSFNCSFIDSPSAAWDSASFSSFETDEGEPLYCVPTQEGNVLIPPACMFQELSSRCNYFPAEQSDLASEDGLELMSIPRTSSIVKAKRPSVSFAEGTKFGPELRRGSMPESRIVPAANPQRKRKLSWTLSKLSPIVSEPAASAECQPYECTVIPGIYSESEGPHRHGKPPARGRSRDHREAPSTARRERQMAESSVTMVLSTEPKSSARRQKVGTGSASPGEAKRSSKLWESSVEGIGVGTVQAMLKRFGSFQRQRSSPKEELRPRLRGENVNKIHRKLAALDRSFQAQSPEKPASPAEGNIPSTLPGKAANATHQPGQTEGNGTLTKKPVIPTTPVLQRLVANVSEEGEREAGLVPPARKTDNAGEQHPGNEDNLCDQEHGNERSVDIASPVPNPDIH
ncbi:uncharacterized protein LOC144491158, partial [Mustelus asterias]